MTGMEEKFRQIIKDSKFNYFELEGFKVNPELALMAGMAIGYRLGIDEGLKVIKKLMVEVDKIKAVALIRKACGIRKEIVMEALIHILLIMVIVAIGLFLTFITEIIK